MKTVLILIFSTSMLFSGGIVNGKGFSEYFICKFNDSISKLDIEELKSQGFLIVEKDNNQKMVYVKSKDQKEFSAKLKSRMKEVIKVDKNGNETVIVRTKNNSPEFVKLIFNFI